MTENSDHISVRGIAVCKRKSAEYHRVGCWGPDGECQGSCECECQPMARNPHEGQCSDVQAQLGLKALA